MVWGGQRCVAGMFNYTEAHLEKINILQWWLMLPELRLHGSCFNPVSGVIKEVVCRCCEVGGHK